MGRKRSLEPKEKKRKRVTVQLLPREHAGKVVEAYQIMEDLLSTVHGHLRDLQIAIAWRLGWRADADGHLRLGQTKKRGDLDRELDSYDFIILLNKEAWPTLNTNQKRALIDHELCHAQIVLDADGEPKKDDRGRQVLRVRKHDLEEFQAVIDRNGFYTSTLSEVAKATIADAKRPLLAGLDDDDGKVGEGNGDGQAETTQAPAADGWKRKGLKSLGLNDSEVEKFVEADIRTLGKLSALMEEYGQWWNREVAGIGDKGREKVENLFVAFWKAHPEYCLAQKADQT